jgi:ferrous iron transport protein B
VECHDCPSYALCPGQAPVVLVGNPNVGKSVLFGALTGRYANVSNYPGTTIEVAVGTLNVNGASCPVIDTPGIQSIVPFSDDERVTRDILLTHFPATIVQVVDAKNLQRGLLIALELAEAGLPFVLTLNMTDEAERRGIAVDAAQLSALLGVPVSSTVATQRTGLHDLVRQLAQARPASYRPTYDPAIENAVARLEPHMPESALAPRALALMVLAGCDDLLDRLALGEVARSVVHATRASVTAALEQSPGVVITRTRLAQAAAIQTRVLRRRATGRTWADRLGRWTVHPIGGWPILALILYATYLFVGVLGAGMMVDWMENVLFGRYLNPAVTWLVTTLVPVPILQELMVGDYGLVTMALTYSLAIVLPIVGAFFIAFSLLEDSGYLPRLAVMLDRGFRLMGLNGKAVLPMILGLGCDTMATMTTRILETRKERIQVTLLLALAVPCSAQLGVILGMLGGLSLAAALVWLAVVIGVLLVVGYLAARLIPGRSSDFILELPPLRLPELRNVVLKTAARVEWYLKEAVPVFLIGTAVLFTLDKLRILSLIERAMAPLIVGWLGLPAETTAAFLIGFLRRDYGAAGLFEVARHGGLDPVQTVVSLVVITLFMPCIANLLMIVKEHGMRTALAVTAVVFPLAFVVGGLLRLLLTSLPGMG